jgi:ABC-type glycerol-3-phosphate transport system substrate-binding protein
MHERDDENADDDTTHLHPRRLSRRAALGTLGAVALGAAGVTGTIGVVRHHGPAKTSGRVPITIWSWQSSAEIEALKDAAASFNASQEESTVKIVQRPDAYSTFQLTLTIRDRLGPDLCIGGRDLLAERDALGLCQDLTPYLADAGPELDLDRDFLSVAVKDVRRLDRILGIPLDTTVRLLMFNRSALASSGIDPASWQPDHGPVTFDHLAQVAHSLDRKDTTGAFERVGFAPTFGAGSADQYLHSWGAQYFDDTRCAFALTTPEALGAAQWVHDDIQHEGAALLQKGQSFAAPGTPFLQGDVAFALGTDRDLDNLSREHPDIDVGATFVPTPDASTPSRSWATGNALSLMTGAKHPEEAVRFLTYMAQEDTLSRYCLGIGSLSSRKTMTPEFVKGLARPAFITDAVLPGAVPTPHVPIATQFGALLGGYWSHMLAGSVGVGAGLNELQAGATQALAQTGLCS